MEPAVQARYHDAILTEAMRRYGIAEGDIHLLDGFESFMYAYERAGQSFILRIGHSLRRSVDLIQGEVDWLNYLAAGGVSVAAAHTSLQSELVECIDDGQGGQFLVTAFTRAPGRSPEIADWQPPLFEEYGRMIGRMHRLTQAYQLPDPAWKRFEWDAPGMLDIDDWLTADHDAIRRQYEPLKAHLFGLPKDDATYGLVHQDAHGGNFFVDDAGTLTFFDFDDCAYTWFINDIAIVLFYALSWSHVEPGFTHDFMPPFLRGYRAENQLDARWLPEIPHFLKLREIDMYLRILRDFEDYEVDRWAARFMHGRRARIEQGVPYVEYDFASLTGLL
ncbi:MAG: hypothetical protein CL610_23410 [Anaerolineaceae bacterium]|nr:hypothetical protein [Anaerolineaceae bacterium]